VADLAAGVDALGGEGAEDRGPVGRPCFVAFEVRLGNKLGDAGSELVDYGDGFCASGDDGVVAAKVRRHFEITA
jgi:hypothetical protein